MEAAQLLGIGLVAGVVAGLFGVGGGLVIVPALALFMGLRLKLAIGTSLATLLLPVGILGVIEYYRSGNVNVKFAALVAVGLLIGTFFGAKLTNSLSPLLLRRIYAIFLFLVAVKMMSGR